MVRLQHVKKSFQTPAGAFEALRGVDLEIGTGEFVAVVGKSGSGKTTLLNMVAGIDRPCSGTVTVADATIHGMGENKLAAWRGRNIGVVFQFFQLLPTLSVAENVMLPMDFSRTLPVAQRRKRALELLQRVNLAEQADKLPAALSGGQQQRVAIARAMANAPRVVLADEPTGNLDSETAGLVLDLFRDLTVGGTTVIVVTHERDIARRIDRIVELADGRVVTPHSAGTACVGSNEYGR